MAVVEKEEFGVVRWKMGGFVGAFQRPGRWPVFEVLKALRSHQLAVGTPKWQNWGFRPGG